MFSHLELDNYAVGIPVIVIAVVGFVIGQIFFKRFFHKDKIDSCHEVGGTMLQVLGTLYAVILGLIVLDAMAKFETAQTIILNESQSLLVVFELAEQFKFEGRGETVRQLTEDYLDEVITNDWRFMDDNILNYKAIHILRDLIDEVKKITPIAENEKQLFPTLIQESLSVWKCRVARVNQAEYGLPRVEWVILLIGGAIIIMFTYFFRIENQKIQSYMTGLFALIIIMNLYMVLLFSEPYSGDFVASKKPLMTIQEIMRGTYFHNINTK
jgi:hypothetical protein